MILIGAGVDAILLCFPLPCAIALRFLDIVEDITSDAFNIDCEHGGLGEAPRFRFEAAAAPDLMT